MLTSVQLIVTVVILVQCAQTLTGTLLVNASLDILEME